MEEYLKHNKDSWNKRTRFHVASDFYDNESFIQGRNSLNAIELEYLKDIQGKSVLHLQSHFGQDSISLSRMGATVTAVDLSDAAIKEGRRLAESCGEAVRFIETDVYSLPNALDEQFDCVFTSYGTIGWLPDLTHWAQVVNRFLKPGGRFIFAEFHPVVWMFDDDFTKVGYGYFKSDPIVGENEVTYGDRSATFEHKTVSWNHSLDEVMGALLAERLQISAFREYDYSPYDCFRHTEEFEPGKFRIKHIRHPIPMVYLLEAKKP